MNARGPTVTFVDVTKRYRNGGGIANVSLAVDGGCFVALVGASGSGKSTLLKTINRLIEPDSGRVTIDGDDINNADRHDLCRRIGYVIQGVGLFPHLDVAANIAMPLRIAGQSVEDRVDALLDLVDLPRTFGSRMPDTLSGGQRQRVGFARALALSPTLMLMDEPFGALDPLTRDVLGKSYRALHERMALTTIMVTHDMAEALLLADRVVVLDRGGVIANETPSALLRGQGGPVAQAMVAVPRAQSQQLSAMAR